jgi:hypothetical protein
MFHPTLKHFAVMVVAGLGWCLALSQSAHAGGLVSVSTADVADAQCDECQPGCCDCFCRRLRLHCIYFRKSCHRRYIALPYTDPNSIMYYSPGMTGAGLVDPSCPPGGGSYGYQGGSAYGNPGYVPQPYAGHPAYAPPGSIFIR